MRIKTTLGITTFALLPFLMTGCSDNDVPGAAFTITATGGLGGSDGGSGGSGNSVRLYKESGTGPAEMLKSGRADASFSALTPSTNLGANPLSITANTTLTVETVEPAAGTPYFVANNADLYISDGDNVLESADVAPTVPNTVTGISIASGATLTLPLNYTTYLHLYVTNDISNNGTITTADENATKRGDLRIDSDSYVGSSTSSISTAGTLDSQNGGYVNMYTNGSLYNHGSITTRGSDSAAGNGGAGGYVYIRGNYNFQNTAAITSRGGDAPAGIAGDGGDIYMEGTYGYAHNSGDLSSFGGNGGTGGDGGYAYVYADSNDSLNSGDSDSHGGTGSTGDGGDGDYFYMESYGGNVINTGNIVTSGGATTAAAANGGDGGYAYFYAEYVDLTDGYTPPGSVLVSGNITTSGGNAVATGTGDGGDAGYVYAETYSDEINSADARVAFLGYGSINTSGGDGNYGGNAANFEIYNEYMQDYRTQEYEAGNVTNEANLTARGGNAVATATAFPATGGRGGNFYLETEYYYGYNRPDLEITVNTGNADLSGGSNLRATSNSSGRSGSAWFWGYNGVTNSGSITANGGNDADTDGGVTGYGGYGNDIQLWAETGSVKNTGALTTNGGNGEYRGGYSDGIELWGATVSNKANLTSNGGNASTTLAAAEGGDGGWIELFSPQGSAGVSHSGTISQTAGTGTVTYGVYAGSFIKGGMCVSGPCN